MTQDSTPSLAHVAFLGRCPKCGMGRIYSGLLEIRQQCEQCGFPFRQHEQGDGPAFFSVLIIGALAAIGAAIVEVRYEPSFWVHAAIWLPFVVIASLLSLRIMKAALIGVQYQLRKQDFNSPDH